MNQAHSQVPDRRCVDCPSALYIAGALDKIISLLELFDKARDILYAVLIVPVYRDDPPVAPLKRPVNSHAQLGALPALVLLDKQRVDLKLSKPAFLHAAVRRTAVTDDNIRIIRNVVLICAVQFL